MIVPVVTSPGAVQSDHDHRDLLTALKLLSGQECVRDARQAQVLLVGLTESRHKDVAEDARAVMRAGLSRGWFEDKAPAFYELRNLAEKSLATYEKGPVDRQKIMVAAGLLVLLFGGLVAFFVSSGAEIALPNLFVVLNIGVIAVLMLVVFYLKSKRS